MEKQFHSSKNAFSKARTAFWFYTVCTPMLLVLCLIPFLLHRTNRIEWFAIIYILIAAIFVYKGYRAYCILRTVRNARCVVSAETVSGISTHDPYQKGTEFRILNTEIIYIEERIVSVEKKGDITYGPSLHRSPFSSQSLSGYRSTVIHTK